MKCEICEVSMFEKPLTRTQPTGQPNAGWMCQRCIKNKKTELFNKLKYEGDLKLTNDIFNAINNKKSYGNV